MDNIICIAGPTATGKTKLSVALAQALGAEIVSFDSMQVYRGMDIGTAKPDLEERGGVPHYMFDVADPAENFSVSRYVEMADPMVQDILRRGKPVILVGGTGLYADSLVAGRDFAPMPRTGRREALEKQAAEEGIGPLYEKLKEVDPESAAAIHPANQKRVIRALEVYLETGRPLSQHNRETREKPPKYHPIWIGLDYVNREDLYARIDARVDEMFRLGLAEEVESLLKQGIPENATSMQAIGYKELVSALRGELSMEEARENIKKGTRHYAKRQRTWFRRNPAIHWLELPGEPDFEKIYFQARQLLPQFDT